MGERVNLGRYITRFNGRIGTFKKGVLLKLFEAVVKDTPVLTGRLRGNWTFTKGSAGSQSPDTTPEDKSGEATMSAITVGVKGQVKAKDETYFLTNTMPYTNRIEYGGHSSVKAPQGMVRRNMRRIAKLLANQAALGR